MAAAIGVIIPASRSSPSRIAPDEMNQTTSSGLFNIQSTPYTIIVTPSETRRSKSPTPGGPAGKVEKNLCVPDLLKIERDLRQH
jgi:hypothetical protein